ncbi:hypothetical protein L596_005152 [Steinernema carpocapsae]|uniref:Uncharacterized protein n=1 Tax=Steinernema carpocapsae TaxID=34508 RepID=A0A4V6I8E3_STECR|nr:hypothetical protein L596_005152 [Steinernema carpocapsae]
MHCRQKPILSKDGSRAVPYPFLGPSNEELANLPVPVFHADGKVIFVDRSVSESGEDFSETQSVSTNDSYESSDLQPVTSSIDSCGSELLCSRPVERTFGTYRQFRYFGQKRMPREVSKGKKRSRYDSSKLPPDQSKIFKT